MACILANLWHVPLADRSPTCLGFGPNTDLERLVPHEAVGGVASEPHAGRAALPERLASPVEFAAHGLQQRLQGHAVRLD